MKLLVPKQIEAKTARETEKERETYFCLGDWKGSAAAICTGEGV